MPGARFFVDENNLALAKALRARRDGIVHPGHLSPRGPEIEPRRRVALDLGARSLVALTRDHRIRYQPVEKRGWTEYRVRGFVLTGRTSQSTRDSREILERHWNLIERIVDDSRVGP